MDVHVVLVATGQVAAVVESAVVAAVAVAVGAWGKCGSVRQDMQRSMVWRVHVSVKEEEEQKERKK